MNASVVGRLIIMRFQVEGSRSWLTLKVYALTGDAQLKKNRLQRLNQRAHWIFDRI
jgi:hypothetical protein